jgi:hypothetical protein
MSAPTNGIGPRGAGRWAGQGVEVAEGLCPASGRFNPVCRG